MNCQGRNAPDSGPLSQARALEQQGLSREACEVLVRALSKDPGHLDWMRTLSWWLYRDGREVELLALFAKGPKTYAEDAYLVLQKASCLYRLRRFGEARKEYHKVLDLTRDPALRIQAEKELQQLKKEEAIYHIVMAGLHRARIGILGGTLVVGGGGLFLWFARRREQIAGLEDIQDS